MQTIESEWISDHDLPRTHSTINQQGNLQRIVDAYSRCHFPPMSMNSLVSFQLANAVKGQTHSQRMEWQEW